MADRKSTARVATSKRGEPPSPASSMGAVCIIDADHEGAWSRSDGEARLSGAERDELVAIAEAAQRKAVSSGYSEAEAELELRREPTLRVPIRTENPFLVPAIHTGIVGALQLIDVRDDAQRKCLRSTFYATCEMPSLERLQIAKRLIGGLEHALHGNDARVWRAVQDALDRMVSLDTRYIALEHLTTINRFRLKKLASGRDPLGSFARLPPQSAVRRAFAALRTLDPRLVHIEPCDVFVVLEGVIAGVDAPKRGRGNKSVLFALARLAIRHGAWGAIVSNANDEGRFDKAVRRYAMTLSNHWKQAPKRVRKKNSRTA